MVKAEFPSAQKLAQLDEYEADFQRQVGQAIRWLFDHSGLNPAEVHARIPGITEGVWRKYGQPGYTKNRSLHAVAALGWISGVSMSLILRGEQIAQYWEGASREKIEALVSCGMLTNAEFKALMMQLANRLEPAQSARLMSRLSAISPPTGMEAPATLSLDSFRIEYYRSIARALIQFRMMNNFSFAQMAAALGVSVPVYRGFENMRNPPKSINLLHAARLKLAFNIDDTTQFLRYMKRFRGCQESRSHQQEREVLVLELLNDAPSEVVSNLVKCAQGALSVRINLGRFADYARFANPVL